VADSGLFLPSQAFDRATKGLAAAITDLDENEHASRTHHKVDFAATKAAVTLNQHQALAAEPVTGQILGPLAALRCLQRLDGRIR